MSNAISRGLVYQWKPGNSPTSGQVERTICELPDLESASKGLEGRYAAVINRGKVNVRGSRVGSPVPASIGAAHSDVDGNFFFEPGRGGERIDWLGIPDDVTLCRYIQAAHFGEVNTYFHLTRIARYIDSLLENLGSPPIPRVTAAVCAHNCVAENNGKRDGAVFRGQWRPFEGGHYRLPARRYDSPEWHPIEESGEIHLGPGRNLVQSGALVDSAGGRYLHNASHNAGTIYHEYGHHLSRHTADFQANRRRPVDGQTNRKSALDEGTSDYWVGTMLDTPHIWAWHRASSPGVEHRRDLRSSRTVADIDPQPDADPHLNGTIWASALWDLRVHFSSTDVGGVRMSDRLILQAMLVMGHEEKLSTHQRKHSVQAAFSEGLSALLMADETLFSGSHISDITTLFARRGILTH